jgi:CRISPR-associated protein Cas1
MSEMKELSTKAAFKNRNATYPTILYRNTQTLANFVIDKSRRLDFDVPTLVVKRNDNLDIQQRSLSMTPDERKRLGMNRSRHWYQKKKLAEGTAIKVYGNVLKKLL